MMVHLQNTNEVFFTVDGITAVFSVIVAIVSVVIAVIVYRGQQRLSQKQYIVPLWEYLSNLERIRPESPVTPHIVQALNTLELVAVTCTGRMVDKKVLLSTFKNEYIRFFESIVRVKEVPGYVPAMSGAQLISESQLIIDFYKELKGIKEIDMKEFREVSYQPQPGKLTAKIDGNIIEIDINSLLATKTIEALETRRKYDVSYSGGVLYITSGPGGSPCKACNGSGVESRQSN